MARQQNVVFQGFTAPRKSYLGRAIAKRACEHRMRTPHALNIRAHYVRMPHLEEAWVAAQYTPGGAGKCLRKYADFALLVLCELLLDRSTESMRCMFMVLMERRYGKTLTVFGTQYSQMDCHQRLGSGVNADAIMDRIIHNTVWVEIGTYNMREHIALASA
nr:ATP-binding protein [Cryobacterium sp. Y82]